MFIEDKYYDNISDINFALDYHFRDTTGNIFYNTDENIRKLAEQMYEQAIN